jgi:hypothetical protein
MRDALVKGNSKAKVTMDCNFQTRRRQKRTESGLSERQFEFKSFIIIVARKRTRSPRKIADWERTGRARRDSAKFLRMMVARDGVQEPTPAFQAGFSGPKPFFNQQLNLSRWSQFCDHSVTSADVRLSVRPRMK